MAGKYCSKCNEHFDEGILFCKFCGLPTTRPEDQTPLPEEKKNSSKVVLFTVLALIIIIIVVLALFIEM